jgi:hypothetical protein
MRTRRRFSAEFKAKVALEAIKGHETRIDASVTSGTRQGSEYATGNPRLSSEPNAVRYTESDIWRLACPRPSLGRNLEFLAVLGSAVDERLVSHTSRISLTQVLRPPVCFYAGRHSCVINRPHRKILRSDLARPTYFLSSASGSEKHNSPRRGERVATACPRSHANDGRCILETKLVAS